MTENKNKRRIGILRGGAGKHYEDSLAKGGEVIFFILENLADRYKVIDIFVDKEGVWYADGLLMNPLDLPNKVDVVWNISHPNFSSFIKNLSVPTIKTSSFSKVISASRGMLQQQMKKIHIDMPRHIMFPAYQKDFDGPRDEYALKKSKEVFEKFSSPWIIRSLATDANVGVHVANTFSELMDAIEDISKYQESILVEELISGKNVFMHTISGFRGEDVYVFPAGNFSKGEKEKLDEAAKKIHQRLDVSSYLKSNFVLNLRKRIYLTSVEFFPDLKSNSHLNQRCESVGAKMHHMVKHIIESNLNKKA
jgi:D-alanine-D-alanine ligase-like ATP-grasp enzyme